jgi:hypothetical protein
MRQLARLFALSTALAASTQSRADDRTGTFATDILAVGNSYALAGASISSELSDISRKNKRGRIIPGSYERHVRTGTMTVRHGLFENTDVTVSLPYQPVYEFTTAYVGGIPQKVDAQQGWGSPSFRVAYGLVGDASKPYSVAVALTAVADMMGNSTGSMTPAVSLGYKLNETSRLYVTTDLYYPLRTNGSTQQTLRLGGQYDLTPSLTFDLSAQHTHLNRTSSYEAFRTTAAQIDLIYKVTDNFYVSPSFTNEWRSDKANKNGITVFKSTSDIRSYELSIKYLF